ncbi:MAG: IS1595 family transposase [Chlamydiia bacterium]|nr:IS1595 family transposase [Chlamydiia bacterium]
MSYKGLSDYQVKRIMRCFCVDITASKTAELLNINRNTINRYFLLFRQKIAEALQVASRNFSGEIELDESYFGAKRVRGKRGRGAAGKTPVFGVLKRKGHVYVEVVKNCSKASLMPIIQGKILSGSTLYTDGWKAYDGLILNGYDHYRIFHSENEFARGKNHVNGIEAFWSFAKRRLSKFNGLQGHMFLLHLKECEFRFNYKDQKLDKILWSIWKNKSLKLV